MCASAAAASSRGKVRSIGSEIRPASNGKQRLTEAARLGFSDVLDSDTVHLREALRRAFAGASVERVDVPDF